jgi:hypothetical protein
MCRRPVVPRGSCVIGAVSRPLLLDRSTVRRLASATGVNHLLLDPAAGGLAGLRRPEPGTSMLTGRPEYRRRIENCIRAGNTAPP